MSNEVRCAAESGISLYALFFKSNKVLNENTLELDMFPLVTYSDYVISGSELGSTGVYIISVPAGTPAGSYDIFFYKAVAGAGNEVEGDPFAASPVTITWNGTGIVDDPGDDVDENIALVTLTQAKNWLQITATSENTIIARIINRCSQYAARYCGRNLISQDYTEYYDGNGTPTLIVRNYPIVSVTSVNIDSTRSWSSSSLVDLSSNALIDKTAGIVRLWNSGGYFYKGKANVRIIYNAGYATGSVPHDLQDAVLYMVMESYKRGYQDQRIGVQSETAGERTITYDVTEMPKRSMKILNQFRLKQVPDYAYSD